MCWIHSVWHKALFFWKKLDRHIRALVVFENFEILKKKKMKIWNIEMFELFENIEIYEIIELFEIFENELYWSLLR